MLTFLLDIPKYAIICSLLRLIVLYMAHTFSSYFPMSWFADGRNGRRKMGNEVWSALVYQNYY